MQQFLSRNRLSELLDRATGRRVVVVGDVMLDVYLSGDVERISPEAPVPVMRVRERRDALGGAANVAQNVHAIGAECDLVGIVGDDAPGRRLRSLLQSVGGSAQMLVQTGRPTTTKSRIVARSQQLLRVDEEDDGDIGPVDAERVEQIVAEAIQSADALVLEDYNKGMLVPRVILAAMAAARARGIPIVVDPKYRHFFLYKGATVFKPNRRELEAALGASVDLEHADGLPAAFARLEVDNLLLTLGAQGMILVGKDGEAARVPTVAREVYDVVGAGDTATAYLATMLAVGASAVEAAVVSNYAAGVEVGKLGAATVSAHEVLHAYDSYASENLHAALGA